MNIAKLSTIKEHIGANKLDLAIDQLFELCSSGPHSNIVLLINGRYSQIKELEMIGSIYGEKSLSEWSKVRGSIMELIGIIEKGENRNEEMKVINKEVPNSLEVKNLIEILEYRAQKIKDYILENDDLDSILSNHFLKKFGKLHEKHTIALSKLNLKLAREIDRDIQILISNIQDEIGGDDKLVYFNQ